MAYFDRIDIDDISKGTQTNDVKITLDGESLDTELPAAAALADSAANPTTPTVGSANLVYNGTTWDRQQGTTAHTGLVSVAANNSGTAVDLGIYNATQSVLSVGIGAFPTGDDALQVNTHIITSINHGRKTVTSAGTDEALAGSTTCKRVILTAETDNTGVIAVGGSGVDATQGTRTGAPLFAGDTLSLDIDNLADIYIDSTVSGDGVTYVYLT